MSEHYSEIIVHFGNFKHYKIGDIPSDYLLWLSEACDDERICCAADEEYRERSDSGGHFYDHI